MENQTIKITGTCEYFANEDKARELLEKLRWPNGVVCPHCKEAGAYKIQAKADSKSGARKGLWKCKNSACYGQFTVQVGTIFEDSRIPLNKWLKAIYMICSGKKGVSALQMQRDLELGSYKSAWFMMHRIRHAMAENTLGLQLSGIVEADETYIGGKAKNMHAKERKEKIQGRGAVGKAPVVTLVERDGRVKSTHLETVTGENLKTVLRKYVAPDANLMTDESPVYNKMAGDVVATRESVNHSQDEYVRGAVHVNSAESVHALLKRGIVGIYHHVSTTHLHRYLNEFDFRFNARKVTDSERTLKAIAGIEGKRLTYKEPIGRNKQ